MKPENLSEDKPLAQALRSWQIEAPLPPRFTEGVWKKIEHAAPASTTTLWNLLRIRIAETFARPSLAVCYVASLLLIGLAAALLSAQYVQTVDPYQRSDR